MLQAICKLEIDSFQGFASKTLVSPVLISKLMHVVPETSGHFEATCFDRAGRFSPEEDVDDCAQWRSLRLQSYSTWEYSEVQMMREDSCKQTSYVS